MPAADLNPAEQQYSSSSMNDEWQPPVIEGAFRSGIGSSVVEEFILAHSLPDVLRELVQNEFDAGGSKLSIKFGDSVLKVSGNGKPIDRKGRLRLSAILGTGAIVGDNFGAGEIPAKENGIGSKNFGLRSLFLIGDRIHIRSNGTMVILGLPELGTIEQNDLSSKGRRGVEIIVPYRTEPNGRLEPFSLEREHEAFNNLSNELLSTLTKLALIGQQKGIEQVEITSKRLRRRLDWRQSASKKKCRAKSVSCVQRKGTLRETDLSSGRESKRVFEELEFSRFELVPFKFLTKKFPPYFKKGGQLKVCVSVPVHRG